MTKQFLLQKAATIFFLFLFIMIGCNSGSDKNTTTNSASKDSNMGTPEAVAVPALPILSGYLDTLYVDSLNFSTLNKDMAVFAFYAGQNDTLTLHGWYAKGLFNKFDSLPNIQLAQGRASTVTYGNGTYFRNVVLSDINEIKRLLKTKKAKYVLFAPQKSGNIINYKIYLSNDDPKALVKSFAVIPTGIETNPTPPKQYQ